MNHAQKNILTGALVATVGALLFPPFQFVWTATISLGYGFLLSPPTHNSLPGTVDVALLLAEWIAVAIVCGILWALKRDKPTEEIMSLSRKIHADPRAKDAVYEALYALGDQRGKPFF